jgi:hypothetical protein
MKPTLILAAAVLGAPGEYSPAVTHPYLAFSTVSRAELLREGKKRVEVVRRIEEKTQTIAGVECLVLVEEETVDGKLHEVARNYFAQKDGAVYSFGEDVDNYKDGKVADHDGSWRVGREVKEPFLFLPAELRKGDTFKPEDVKGVAEDVAEIVAVGETLEVGGTTYPDVLKIKLTIVIDKEVKTKYYAKGVGLIREEEGADKVLNLRKIVRKTP